MKIVSAVLALLSAADAAIMGGSCSDIGTKKRTETWTCSLVGTVQTAVCGKEETTCYCDGGMLETSGSGTWDNGVLVSVDGSTYALVHHQIARLATRSLTRITVNALS